MTKISREDVEVLLRRAGLSLSPAQIDQTCAAWGLVQPMLERIRIQEGGDATELAPVFRADGYPCTQPHGGKDVS